MDSDQLRKELVEILTVDVEDDAIEFDLPSLSIDAIRNQSAVLGLRAKLDAYLGRIRIRCQIDVGLGDTVFPSPVPLEIDSVLDLPVATVRAYTPYSAVAEKLEAIIVLGMANTRMKDYYDLTALPAGLDFDGQILVESVRRTFGRRATAFPPGVPDGLGAAFAGQQARATQWRAFLRKSRLDRVPEDLEVVVAEVARFLLPVVEAARDGNTELGNWPAGGPWERA